jgi:threonine/homoserine efflux transporter RhtA
MDALGINWGMLGIQLVVALLLLALPLTALIDLGRKKLDSLPSAIWALTICLVPLLGALAYWIVKPSNESRL